MFHVTFVYVLSAKVNLNVMNDMDQCLGVKKAGKVMDNVMMNVTILNIVLMVVIVVFFWLMDLIAPLVFVMKIVLFIHCNKSGLQLIRE